jgi:hypothetical protein
VRGAGSTAGVPQRRQSLAVRYRRGRFLGCGCWLDLRAAGRCVGASTRGRVDVRGALGRSSERCSRPPDQVEVSFYDSKAECYDFVICADGVHSGVRTSVFGPAGRRAALLSASGWRFMTTNPGVDCWSTWTGPAETFFLSRSVLAQAGRGGVIITRLQQEEALACRVQATGSDVTDPSQPRNCQGGKHGGSSHSNRKCLAFNRR